MEGILFKKTTLKQNSKICNLLNLCNIDSEEYKFAEEMFKNQGLLCYCCNPNCKSVITSGMSMIFDSVFCSKECSDNADKLLMDLWLRC